MVGLGPVSPGDGGRDEPEPTPAARLLLDAFGRISEAVDEIVDGLDVGQLAWRPSGDANSIAWLVWHLTRIQDDHVAAAFGHEQVWTADGWFERFGLPFDAVETGYGHSSEEVAAVRIEGALLREYHRAAHRRTEHCLRRVTEADLERVVDERWDPPVTLAVRLVSVLGDDLAHAGQAAYARGLVEPGFRGGG